MDSDTTDPRLFQTAAAHASREVPVARPGERVGDVRRSLLGRRFAAAGHLVVCEGERFAGIVRLEDLLAAPEEQRVEQVMDREAPVVAPGVDQEIAAWRAARHRESALSVVDRDGRFVGLIPPHLLLLVLLTEHEEDLSRLGGFLRFTREAQESSVEPVERRFLHRLPWLLLGLIGAMVAADVVSWFETRLQETVMLAFFIPGIVYLADAVGTQTETVVVRGLSIGVRMRRMIGRELLAGLLIGVAIAAAAGPIVWWRWGDGDVALCVGLSLFAACSTAAVTAVTLPALFQSMRMDPAFGSGPLATVIQDLWSILIYFAVAAAVLP